MDKWLIDVLFSIDVSRQYKKKKKYFPEVPPGQYV